MRRQTLEEVATLLYGAYLDKFKTPKSKNYILTEKHTDIAAEKKMEYGEKNDSTLWNFQTLFD